MGQIDESRVFQLGVIFAAQENNPTGNIYLTGLEGWDETKNEILTVPKLFGAGVYITEKRLPERVVTVTVTFADGDLFVGNIVNELEYHVENMIPVTATRQYGSRRTESLTVYITEISSVEKWSDNEATVEIKCLAVNPVKTIS